MTHVVSALLLVGGLLASPAPERCAEHWVTGYVRSEYGPYTYDGTPIGTAEPIVAAAWDIPIGSTVEIDDLGTFRVADRGLLGSDGWLDVAVWTRSEAYAITGLHHACVTPP